MSRKSEKARIQIEKTGFPRIKYGAGSIKSGMTQCVKSFLRHYTSLDSHVSCLT